MGRLSPRHVTPRRTALPGAPRIREYSLDACTLPSLPQCLTQAGPLEQARFVISVLGLVSLVGIIAALVSMRVTVCNQLYSRWQSLLFKFADTQGANEYLRFSEYRMEQTRPPAHYIAVAYMNLFEEAFRYRHARILVFWRVLPNAFWISIENSMKKQFTQFLYLRTFWQMEQSSFSADFNDYVRTSVRPFD